jgi:hypothetical protein
MQVVIAENGDRRFAEATYEAEYFERLRAPVDEVSDEPESVSVSIEVKSGEQLFELDKAALHVADGVGWHSL